MKLKNLLLSFLFVILLGAAFCLVGCGDNPSPETPPDETTNPPPVETTFEVHVNLNNSSYGSLIIDGLKTKYEEGDEITIRVAPNLGYYLRSYSDCDSKELTRKITVTKSENITVNLVEGEACTFYGYHIAANCTTEQKMLGSTEKTSIYQGGLTQFVKYLPNKNITSGNLALLTQEKDDFGYWEIKQGETQKIISNPETADLIFDFLITEDYLKENFGDNKNDWIDITEYDTHCGYAFTLARSDSQDDACRVKIPTIFNPDLFVKTKLYYIYSINDNLIVEGFENNDGNVYQSPHSATSRNMCNVKYYRLFTIDGTLYYTANATNYMLSQSQTYSKEITFCENTYTIKFVSPQ